MEVCAYNFKVPMKKNRRKVLMVKMTKSEAIRTIQSLSEQMVNGSPNSGRWEHYDINGIDFSIAVDDSNAKT
jgi:hypothetical protein